MEELPGVFGKVPPLAEYPGESVRASLPPADWQACLDSWLLSLEYRLRLQDNQFEKLAFSSSSSLRFITTYCEARLAISRAIPNAKEVQLHQRIYLLFKRLLLSARVSSEWKPMAVVKYLLLADQTFHHVSDWSRTLLAFHERQQLEFAQSFDAWKTSTIASFEAREDSDSAVTGLRRMSLLIQKCPAAGLALMTGSDYLESIIEAYQRAGSLSENEMQMQQQILTEHLHRCLRSLVSDKTKYPSLLLDHLYLLKSEVDRAQKRSKFEEKNLLSSVLCTTSLLTHLARDVSVLDTQRGRGQIEMLSSYREQTRHLYPPPTIRRVTRKSKGKGKANAKEDFHVHSTAQISQIHDLFPGLSNAYILQLLDHFGDNVETVIGALLEPESLPASLREPDTPVTNAIEEIDNPPDLAPRSKSSLLPQRKNVFDDDEFDRLKILSNQVHRGRRDLSREEPASGHEHARSKAAIMAALAAFDSDDDERDDTYDVADVGGSVDQSVDTDSRPRGERSLEQNPHEEALFKAWKGNTGLFARDSKTRVSPLRQDLKRRTGMSDEQIEGWAIMLDRDQKLQDRLQKRYADAAFITRNLNALERTRWQHESSREASADESEGQASSDGRRMGQAQIRGTRNWGRGRGGSTSGSANDAATQAARRRKEQGRGRGGGHNRREGRARKMGRGMAGPTGQ